VHLLATAASWTQPNVDYHAIAPEIVLTGAIVVLLLADLMLPERQKWATSTIAGLGLLAAAVPVITLAVDGADRSLFGGAYAVDNFALALKAVFLAAGYVVVLLSANYVEEGDFYQGEY
jgi:NADH-quinone oxidoreductase subunit N